MFNKTCRLHESPELLYLKLTMKKKKKSKNTTSEQNAEKGEAFQVLFYFLSLLSA